MTDEQWTELARAAEDVLEDLFLREDTPCECVSCIVSAVLAVVAEFVG